MPVVFSVTATDGEARAGILKTAHGELRIQSLSSFGEDARGRVYATSLAGQVYRLTAR